MNEGFAKQAKELVDLLNKSNNDGHKKFLNESLQWLGRAEAMQAEALHFRYVADMSTK
jgi:hypothetical protein